MDSRAALTLWPTRQASLARVSQVPDDSVGIRCPLSPRRARPLHLPVASRSMAGFTPSGRLATLNLFNEAESGSPFALRLTPLPSEASTAGLLRQPLGRLQGERATTMVSTLQLTRTVKLRLTHQKVTKVTKKTKAGFSFFVTFVAFCSNIGFLSFSSPGLAMP